METATSQMNRKTLLYNRVEELKRSNAALLAENDMFERFLSRLDPQEPARKAAGEGAAGGSPQAGGHGWSETSCSYISDRVQQLTLDQKLYIAQSEITATLQDQEKLAQRYEKIQDKYKASLEEAELHLSEIRKAKNEFECRLLKPMKEGRLEMKPEKVLRGIQDKSKLKQVSQLEKLRLKNQMLKAQEKQLQQQLRQKKEMRKADEEIFQDYEEQRIDNNLDEIQDTLKAKRILSSYKEKLQNVTRESTELSNDIANRKVILAKIEEQIQYVEEERLKAEAFNQHLRCQMTDYQAPAIMEYIHIKAKHKKLKQSIHFWERKVEIAQMTLKNHTKAQRATLTPANSIAAEARSADHQRPVRLPNIPQ